MHYLESSENEEDLYNCGPKYDTFELIIAILADWHIDSDISASTAPAILVKTPEQMWICLKNFGL